MWVFYLISLPLTVGMVGVTLWYFMGPDVARYVRFTVGYTWFCSLSIVILVPADIWTAITNHDMGGISFFWSLSYWSTFLLTWGGSILGFAMACSNTFGLVTGAFLLGFGLSEIPKGIWRNADWTLRHKVLSHKVSKMAVELDDAHQEFSNAIVVAQATSKQMSRRDPLRPYMNIIDDMLVQMLSEDPTFKPQGGKLGETDMDYDTDSKTMAALRRQLQKARDEYYRYKSEYVNVVTEALELEDTVKNNDYCSSNGWKYVSSFRPERKGRLGSYLDVIELLWRCILRKQLEKLLAIILGCMSAAILLAEATILPSEVDLSLFSILINIVAKHEMLVQVTALIPLMYMCVCTYYSLFKIGMLTFYSLTPRQTSSVSLLMICSMVARYAPPISYNFLNLIHLDNGAKTIFEKRMGNIDDAVPFFGKGFNKIYPLIMVIYTILIATNFFVRVINYFGNWKIFRYQHEESDDLDGFDPSGLIILQKERSWLQQGHKVGELVVPLARSFSNATIDLESGSHGMIFVIAPSVLITVFAPPDNSQITKIALMRILKNRTDLPLISESNMHMAQVSHRLQASRFFEEEGESSQSEPLNSSSHKHSTIKMQLGMRPLPTRHETHFNPTKRDSYSTDAETDVLMLGKPSSAIASTWESMKIGFRNLKSSVNANKFIPLSQDDDSLYSSRLSSSESLDEIFMRINRQAA
ncbi:UNVERIFIED_CONTAM: LMBR1 domain-containing protein 2 A [Sesamum indicum]